jgi:hypothetical protein
VSQVPPTHTPCTDEQLLAVIHWACTSALGHAPTDATLAVLCAHVAFETNHMASLVQWNIGNYKRGPGPDWCSFETFEYVGTPPVKKTMVADFSAWPDLNSAASFYVRAFSAHWPEAWAGALAGDTDAFSAGLRKRGYYTAPEQAYAAGMTRWQTYYAAKLAGDEAVTQPEIDTAVDLGSAGSDTLPDADIK